MLDVIPIPAFDDNYIWCLRKPGVAEVVLVDPGDADPVIAYLEAEGLTAAAVLITHHHYDHVGGVADLARRYPLEVFGPADEGIASVTHPVREGDMVRLPVLGAEFRVLDVPGHTRGHVAYVGHGLLFCGDTLFAAGCGRLFEGTAKQMQASLEKIRTLADDTLMYCAHEYTLDNLRFALVVEPDSAELRARQKADQAKRTHGLPTIPSTLGLEKATNPFLRYLEPTVIEAAQAYAGRSLPHAAEVFSVVRAWKDDLD